MTFIDPAVWRIHSNHHAVNLASEVRLEDIAAGIYPDEQAVMRIIERMPTHERYDGIAHLICDVYLMEGEE